MNDVRSNPIQYQHDTKKVYDFYVHIVYDL